jgi:alkylation response protein AidB-like acyl-CoA dehydrogenase
MAMKPIDAALALQPEVRARAREIEEARRLPADLALTMARTGLFRVMAPAVYGGGQASPVDYVRAVDALAEADASTAWCVMIAATTALLTAYLPETHARAVLADPDGVTGGVFAPMGKAVDEGDHWRVSGRWKWASGSQNCNWLAGGSLMIKDGQPLLDEAGQPRHKMFVFPREDVELLDNWKVSGLCGTGSVDMVAKDVLVPRDRAVGLHSDTPRIDAPQYRFPPFGLLAATVASVSLGNARGALDAYAARAGTQGSQGSGRKQAERNVVQAEFARATASLEAARAFFYEAMEQVWEAAQAGRPAIELRARTRLASAHAAQVGADVARTCYDLGGGAAVFLDDELQRRFRDGSVITHHVMVAPAMFELTGRVLFGLPTNDTLI